jgi:hypothetical protein
MFQRLLLTACLMCAASASAQADPVTYTEVGDAGGTTWCGGFCLYASPSELALAQAVTSNTTEILGTSGPDNDGNLSDLFAFYWPVTGPFVVEAAFIGSPTSQPALGLVLLDAAGQLMTSSTQTSTQTQLTEDALSAGNYFVQFASGSVGPYSLTFNHWVDPPSVPLPAALPLFAGGLGVMAWMARRRKRIATASA